MKKKKKKGPKFGLNGPELGPKLVFFLSYFQVWFIILFWKLDAMISWKIF